MLTSIFFKENRCCVIHKLKRQTFFPPRTQFCKPFLPHRRLPPPRHCILRPITTVSSSPQVVRCHHQRQWTYNWSSSPQVHHYCCEIQVHGCLIFSDSEHSLYFPHVLWASVEVRGCFFSDYEHLGLLKTLLSILFITYMKIHSIEVRGWECCLVRFLCE